MLVKIKRYLKYKYRFDGFTLFKKRRMNIQIFSYIWPKQFAENDRSFYETFSPILDSSAYAHYVFNTFDHDRNGSLSFEVSLIFCFELY